jgi:hypothetical protein
VEYVIERLVTAGRDRGLDPLGIDHAAVFEHNRQLTRKERMRRIPTLKRRHAVGRRASALDRGHNLRRLLGTDVLI